MISPPRELPLVDLWHDTLRAIDEIERIGARLRELEVLLRAQVSVAVSDADAP